MKHQYLPPAITPGAVMIRRHQALSASGLSTSGLDRSVKEGLFPSPVKIGQRAVAWPAAEVEAVNRARIGGRTDDEIRALVRSLHAKRLELSTA